MEAYTASTPGTSVDTSSFNSASFILAVGTVTDGEFVFTMQHSDTDVNEDFENVTTDEVVGSLPEEVSTGFDGFMYKVFYRGYKRYVRVNVAATNTTDGAIFHCYVLLNNPSTSPIRIVNEAEEE